MSGTTGYNSFSQFRTGAGTTVDLVLPQSTSTLVNIVRDGPAVVDGTLNSYKNGSIGGNVVFADPYGIVVGKNGVINTGGLTVVTPTSDYLDRVVDAKGRIDTKASAGLLTGDFPISPSGSVVINGRVNAQKMIMIRSFNAAVPGSEAHLMRHQLEFESTVNTHGMSHGGSMVVHNGTISIVAANSVAIGGQLRARSIHVVAAHNVAVYRSAQFIAMPVSASRAGARSTGPHAVGPSDIAINAGDGADIAGTLVAAGRGGHIAIASPGQVTVAKNAKLIAGKTVASVKDAAPLDVSAISITAGSTLEIDGALVANGSAGLNAGAISLAAADITIGKTALLSASGVGAGSSGGTISVMASHDTTVLDGASFVASAGSTGDGGRIDISAAAHESLGSVTLDVGSTEGKQGSVFFDPDDLTISGKITLASSQGYASNGNIVISANDSVELTSNASINTRNLGANGFSTANSGNVTITAPQITLDAGSQILTQAVNPNTANATTGFKDGTVSLIAETTGPLSTGMNFAGTLSVDVAGTVTGGAITVSAAQDQFTGKITVENGGSLDTTRSAANGQLGAGLNDTSIGLTAQTILLQPGSSLTSGPLGYGNSDITLTASNAANAAAGLAIASATIDLNGTINAGGSVKVAARASATSALTDLTHVDDPGTTVEGIADTAVGQVATILLEGGSTLIATDATAKVNVNSGASITAANDISFTSLGIESATNPLASSNYSQHGGFNGTVSLALVGGVVISDVSTNVASGATVSAGGSLAVTASNNATLDVTSTNHVLNGSTFTGGAAVGVALVNTNATVAGGATISTGSNANNSTLSVIAQNENSFATGVTSYTYGNATAGVVLSVGVYQSSANAHLGASIQNTGGVDVQAINDTTKTSTAAEISLGGNSIFTTVLSLAPGSVTSGLASFTQLDPGDAAAGAYATIAPTTGQNTIDSLLKKVDSIPGTGFIKSVLPSTPANTSDLITLAGALNVVETSQSASATISADSGYAAPTITSTGNVAVVSQVVDAGIRQDVTASGSLPANSSDSIASALAVNIGVYFHSSEAVVGNGVSIDADNVGVSATTSMPIASPWATLDGPKSILEAVKSMANANLGVVGNFLTSYANSTASAGSGGSGSISAAGSLDANFVSNTTTAWIASGAKITATDNTAMPWSVALPPSVPTSLTDMTLTTPAPLSFANGVDVEAKTTNEAINVAGNFAWLSALGTGTTGSGNDSAGLGGSLGIDVAVNSTTAGIATGAVVVAPFLTVNAQTTNEVLTVAPTSGKGSDYSLSGIAELLILDDQTHASISNGAVVTAGSVNVTAEQNNSVLGISGAVGGAAADGAGLSLAGTLVFDDTRAYVGDNDGEVSGASYASTGEPAANAQIATDALNVEATATGGIVALSVAAELVSPNDGQSLNSKIQSSGIAPQFVKNGASSLSDLVKPNATATAGAAAITNASAAANSGAIAKIKGLASSVYNGAKNGISGKLDSTLNGTSTPTEYHEVSIAAAGSTSLVVTALDTTASIDGATIKFYPTNVAGSNTVTVQAINDGAILALSGSAAVNLTPSSNAGVSVAVAGAFGLDVNINSTTASISNSTVQAGAVKVAAVSSGDIIADGGALSINSNVEDGVAVAGSLTIGLVLNSDSATVSGSSLIGTASTNPTSHVTTYSGDTSVGSYDSTNIAIGGGGFGGGGAVAVGVALTVAVVADQPSSYGAGATITDSTLSDYGNVMVQAFDVSRILAASGAGAITTGDVSVAGSVTLNDIAPTTSASIDGGTEITSGGNVTVESATNRDAGFDALLASVPMPTSTAGGAVTNALNYGYDFIGYGIGLGTDNTGAAIVALSGALAAGQNGVGAALLYAGVTERHMASISDATITVSGDVTVSASQTAAIYSTAVGLAASTDLVAGLGSLNVDIITDTASATIGASGTTTKITAANLTVTANDSSTMAGFAGGVSGSDFIGIGLAIASGADYDKATAAITNGASVTTTDSVLVQANSSSGIYEEAVAGGVAGDAGLGGAIVFNFNYATTAATISNSMVEATGNIGVLAGSSTTTATLAGSLGVGLQSEGVGETEVANLDLSTTTAGISNSTVDAKGATAAALQVNDGTLENPVDLVAAAKANVFQSPDLSENTKFVHGLAVDATAQQSILTRSGAVGVGINPEDLVAVGLTIVPVVNGLQGATQATISGSTIDTLLAGGDVDVIAGGHSFSENLVGSIAGSTGVAAAGAFEFDIISRTTQASVSGSTIGGGADRAGAVVVDASASNDVYNLVTGVSIGPGALIGSVLLNVFEGSTKAFVTGGGVQSTSLTVTATSDAGSDEGVGQIAGGAVALAGAVAVDVNQTTTLAYVGAGEAGESTSPLKLDVSGAIDVDATTVTNVYDLIVSGSYGGLAGAGSLDANIDLTTTRAGLYGVDNSATPAQSVTVAAEEDAVVMPSVGGVADGAAAFGASANLVVLKSSVTSEIVSSNVSAAGAVKVTGATNRDISLLSLAGALSVNEGGGLARAGAIGLLVAGTSEPGDLSSELNDKIASVDSETSTSLNVGGNLGSGQNNTNTPTYGYQDSSSVAGRAAIGDALNSAADDGITARINSSTVTSGSTSVTATAQLETANRGFGAAASTGPSLGAALVFSFVNDTLVASIDAASKVTTNALTVTATAGDLTHAVPVASENFSTTLTSSGEAVNVFAISGAGGSSALGASVAVGSIDDSVTASIAGQVIGVSTSGTPSVPANGVVTATDSSTTDVDSVGVNLGLAGAIGASISTATQSSQVLAGIAVNTGETAGVTNFGTMSVAALDDGKVTASATAGTAGAGTAVNGAAATATAGGTVNALIGSGASVATTNGLVVTSTANPDVAASSFGVGVAGVAAVGASVAMANADVTVTAAAGDGAQVSAGGLDLEAILAPQSGDSTAYAKAFAGSGSLVVNVQGVVASASTGSTVTAKLGSDVKIDGSTKVIADNTEAANADAFGVNGSLFAAGAVVALATDADKTFAMVGDNTMLIGQPQTPAPAQPIPDTSSVIIAAKGTDSLYANSVAGTGGLGAADASVAKVTGTSVVATTTLGDDVTISTAALQILAQQTQNYEAHADSTNASVVGFSGAGASTQLGSNSSVTTGAADSFVVAGLNGRCESAGCTPAVDIGASNTFNQTGVGANSTPNAKAAAGGVLNGTAAVSLTEIDGTAAVTLGPSTMIVAGSNPSVQPGDVRIAAYQLQTSEDTVSLSTGGAISGAGTNSTLDANLTNTVEIGAASNIVSQGTISAVTYTNADASTNAYTSTTGGVAIGAAEANSTATSTQTVTIDTNATLLGFGNVYATAGEDALYGHITTINATAVAQAFAKGLIGIPAGSASSYATSNTTMTAGTGSSILSGQNVSVGGFEGQATNSSDGTGHGTVLYIGTSTKDDNSGSSTRTSTVELDGAITAGLYHDLSLVFADGPNGATLQSSSGVPVLYTVDPTFDFTTFLNTYFPPVAVTDPNTGAVTYMPSIEAATLQTGLPSTNGAILITSQLYAAGGTATVNADTLTGSGTITAYGSPTISVINHSSSSLILEQGAYIPPTPGGDVLFTGATTSASGTGITTKADQGTGTSTITISNDAAAAANGNGPALIFVNNSLGHVAGGGDLTNIGGLIDIENATGSIGITVSEHASTIIQNAPNGVFVAALNDANGNYNAGSDPISTGLGVLIEPGLLNSAGTSNSVDDTAANEAVQYVANIIYGGTSDLNANIYHNAGYSNQQPQNADNHSTVFYGSCLPFSGGCGISSNIGYQVQPHDEDNNAPREPYIDNLTNANLSFSNSQGYKSLVYQVAVNPGQPLGVSNSIQAYGGSVLIKAAIINVDAPIMAGQPTNQSIEIPAALTQPGGAIYNARLNGQTTVDITPYVSVISAGSTIIKASYNVLTNQITLADVNASSGGGLVILNGAIINTAGNGGKIQVNGGLGQITVNNDTGVALDLGNINTGTTSGTAAIISRIEIVDTLTQTSTHYATVYVHDAATDTTTVYNVQNAAQLGALTPGTVMTGASTTTYAPNAGERFQYVLQATLNQSTDGNGAYTGEYTFDTSNGGTANQPYQYVLPSDPAFNNPSRQASTFSPPTSSNGDSSPVGMLANNLSLQNVAFQETLTGGVTVGQSYYVIYHDHSGGIYGGFPQTNYYDSGCNCEKGGGPATTNDGTSAVQYYNEIGSAWLKLTNSVKADNPIAISFTGNSTASVSVTSDSTITLGGRITNPNGAATLTSTAGDVVQTAAATTITNSLALSATGAIGSSVQPLAIQLTGGSLSASAGAAGIAINAASPVALASATSESADGTSFGDVSLSAVGSITAVSNPVGIPGLIVGNNITLASSTGSIGSAAAPLSIYASGTTLANDAVQGAEINASAYGDIGLNSIFSDMRVGRIVSQTGDLYLGSYGGSVLDAAVLTPASSLTSAQLTRINGLLNLTGSGVATAVQQQVQAYVNKINADAAQVTTLLTIGQVVAGTPYTLATIDSATFAFFKAQLQSALANAAGGVAIQAPSDADVLAYANKMQQANGSFQLATGSAGYASYQQAATTALGLPSGTLASDAQVQTYVGNLYMIDAAALSNAYGSSSATASAFNSGWLAAAQTSGSLPYTSTTNPTVLAALQSNTGLANIQQLTDAVDQSAFGTPVVSESIANLVGRNITITSTAGVGQLASPVAISIADINAGTLSDAQRAALATALTPGSITISGTGPGGATVSNIDLGQVAPGVTPTMVNVKQTAPLFINASGTVNVQAGSVAYLQSVSTPNGNGATLRVGQISASETVSLAATGGIVMANPGMTAEAITTGDLSLAAGSGSIGAANAPLTIDVSGTLLSAAASQDVRIAQTTGNLAIGEIAAGGQVALTVPDSLTGTLPGLSIAGSDISISAGGNVAGVSGMPLAVRVAATGELDGQIAGTAVFYGPAGTGPVPAQLTVGSLSAMNGLTLTADGAISILTSASASRGALAATASSITMAPGASATAQTLDLAATSGDLTVGTLLATASTGQTAITLTATGALRGNGDAATNATAVAGSIALSAGTIGTSVAPLTVAAPTLTAIAFDGDMSIAARGDITAVQLLAPVGTISLSGTDALTVAAATSGANQNLAASGRLGFGTLVAGGTISGSSTMGAIAGGTLQAQGATLTAYGDDTGTSFSVSGAGTLVSSTGNIGWTTVSTGTALAVTASTGAVTLGTTMSGGSQQIAGNAGVSFDTLTSGADISVASAAGTIAGNKVQAAGNATLAAYGDNTGTSLVAGGAGSLSSSNGSVDWSSINTGTTFAVMASTGAVTLGTATSGGSQQIAGNAGVAFDTLTSGGDVTVAAAAGPIKGRIVSAAGNGTLAAYGDNTGTRFSAQGDGTLSSTIGVVDWGTLDTGAGLAVTASTGAVTLGTATSGGSQQIDGNAGVGFDTLNAGGDVTVISTAGTIEGNKVQAAGNGTLAAYGDNTGTSLVTGGAGLLSSTTGVVDWSSVGDGTSFAATATAGTVTLGTVKSGGSQSIAGQAGVTFGTLASTGIVGDPGNIAIISAAGDISGTTAKAAATLLLQGGAITATNLVAGNEIDLDARGNVDVGSLSAPNIAFNTDGSANLSNIYANTISLNANGRLTVGASVVSQSIVLYAPTIDVTDLVQDPAATGPLFVGLAGFNDGLGQTASLSIDAPRGLVFGGLKFDNVAVSTTATNVSIYNGYVPGSLTLATPARSILFQNQTPAPDGSVTNQLYSPNGTVNLFVNGFDTYTTAYVVRFDQSARSASEIEGLTFLGANFVQDFDAELFNSNDGNDWALQLRHRIEEDAARRRGQFAPVRKTSVGPAVNLSFAK